MTGSTEVNSWADHYVAPNAFTKERPTSPNASSTQEAADAHPNLPEGTILTIVPDNIKARMAFHDLIDKKRSDELHSHHAQYIVETGEKPLKRALIKSLRERGETPEEDAQDLQVDDQILLYDGHYLLTFQCLTIVSLKWTMGRGSGRKHGPLRNVDILLVAPDSKMDVKPAATHVLLEMHTVSGVWLLRAAQPFYFGPDLERVPEETYRCLCQPSSSFEISGMRYKIQFAIDNPEKERTYLENRDAVFKEKGLECPTTRISGIPFSSDQRLFNSAVFRHGLGSGSFGNVFEGFEPSTGDLRAVKYICIKNKAAGISAENELQANRDLNGSSGIVRLIDSGNSLQGRSTLVEPDQYPLGFYMVQEKGKVFSRYKWTTEMPDWALRGELCKQLLQGLCVIHKKGWMHRDITPMNILYFDGEPERATLCDFGKLCRTPTDIDTALADWSWLPPELQRGRDYRYNHKLDVWMLALSLVRCWYPDAMQNLKPRERGEHSLIQARLRGDKQSGLSELFSAMLCWEPESRPSAESALSNSALRRLDFTPNKRTYRSSSS